MEEDKEQAPPIRTVMTGGTRLGRELLKNSLEALGTYEIVGTADRNSEAPALARETDAALVIMDSTDADETAAACREIKRSNRPTTILVTDTGNSSATMLKAIAAGANGYFQDREGLTNLHRIVEEVAAGEFRIPKSSIPDMATALRTSDMDRTPADLSLLTRREVDILTSFVRGCTVAQIAARRKNKPPAIRNALGVARKKLGLRSQQELLLWAARTGMYEAAQTP